MENDSEVTLNGLIRSKTKKVKVIKNIGLIIDYINGLFVN